MRSHPLVLIPALASNQRLYEEMLSFIDPEIETVIIRGDGDSIEAMADSVLSQAPPEFFLAGTSMGGYVSLEIALRNTGRVKGLILLNTSAVAAPEDRRTNSMELISRVDVHFESIVDQVTTAVAPTDLDVRHTAATMAKELGPEMFKQQQLAVANRRDRRVELPRLRIRTLVIAGEDDLIVPPNLSREMAALIPGSELTVLDSVGHLSPLEDPSRVASLLNLWLTDLTEPDFRNPVTETG